MAEIKIRVRLGVEAYLKRTRLDDVMQPHQETEFYVLFFFMEVGLS